MCATDIISVRSVKARAARGKNARVKSCTRRGARGEGCRRGRAGDKGAGQFRLPISGYARAMSTDMESGEAPIKELQTTVKTQYHTMPMNLSWV